MTDVLFYRVLSLSTGTNELWIARPRLPLHEVPNVQEEWLYRRSRTRSQAEKADHDKREIRLVAIREELRLLVDKANRHSTHGAVWYS